VILGVFKPERTEGDQPMALDQSVCSELLAALRTGEGVDLVRDAVRLVLQELIETEASSVIGAGRYERSDSRSTERNGHRPRVLSTKAGDVELAIPKLRRGSFFPSILEPRRRIDQALYAVVMEAYVNGVSTRSVDDLVAALGVSSGISKSEVSRICRDLDEVVSAFRNRRLDHQEFPYVYLDATYLHVRSDHHVVSKAAVIATGVRADGHREVLGLDVGDSEDEVFWRSFLRSLKDRGLSGVRLVISDQHAGLVAAIRRCFQGAAHQRCRVHFARNLLACVQRATRRWWRQPFGPSSPRPPRRRCPLSGTTWPPPSPGASTRWSSSWREPRRRSSPSASSLGPTGGRSGARTRWSA
jgi:transposase-like protein